MISTNDFPAVPASSGDGENQPPKGGKGKVVEEPIAPASSGDGENQPPKGGK